MHVQDTGDKEPEVNDEDEGVIEDDDRPMEDDPGDTVVLSEADYSDNVGDISVEINVEELVAKVESDGTKDVIRKKEIRRKLEEFEEAKNFEDTYSIEFDND